MPHDSLYSGQITVKVDSPKDGLQCRGHYASRYCQSLRAVDINKVFESVDPCDSIKIGICSHSVNNSICLN